MEGDETHEHQVGLRPSDIHRQEHQNNEKFIVYSK